MKENIEFVDANNCKASIKIENKEYLSMSGEYCDSMGQCYEHIKPRTDAQKRLLEIWKQYHYKKCDVMDEVKTLIETIKDEERERIVALNSNCGAETIPFIADNLNCCDYDAVRILALAQSLKLTLGEINEDNIVIDTNRKCLYQVYGIEYYVGIEEELEDMARDQMKDVWIEVVKGNYTELGFDDWCDEVFSNDGVASVLNGYDGSYDDVEVDGEWFMVMRY